jgi:hypothetical protein
MIQPKVVKRLAIFLTVNCAAMASDDSQELLDALGREVSTARVLAATSAGTSLVLALAMIACFVVFQESRRCGRRLLFCLHLSDACLSLAWLMVLLLPSSAQERPPDAFCKAQVSAFAVLLRRCTSESDGDVVRHRATCSSSSRWRRRCGPRASPSTCTSSLRSSVRPPSCTRIATTLSPGASRRWYATSEHG